MEHGSEGKGRVLTYFSVNAFLEGSWWLVTHKPCAEQCAQAQKNLIRAELLVFKDYQ